MSTESSTMSSTMSSTVSVVINSTFSSLQSSAMSSIQFSQPHHLITVKLDETNYPLWRAQFLPYLQGYDLDGHVTGETPCPTATLAEDLPNPVFLTWRKQDKILVSWLFSSLTLDVLRHVHRLTTSKEIWSSLESLYCSKSDAQIHHLHCELRALKKGSQSMRAYIDRARDLVDSLAAANTVVTDKESRHCLLAGLDSSYDAIVTSLTTTMSSLTVEDFLTFLLTFELCVEQQNKTLNSQPVANVVSPSRFNAPSSSHPSSTQHVAPPAPSRFPVSNRLQTQRSAIPFQLCGRKNHEAPECWNRFDRSFLLPRRQPPSSAPRAYTAYGPGLLPSPPWTPDSGATDHITNDISHLQFSTEYTGPHQIQMGNGSSIPISSVGTSILGTPNRSMYQEGSSSRQ